MLNGVYHFANQIFGKVEGDDVFDGVSVARLVTKSSGFHCQRSKFQGAEVLHQWNGLENMTSVPASFFDALKHSRVLSQPNNLSLQVCDILTSKSSHHRDQVSISLVATIVK